MAQPFGVPQIKDYLVRMGLKIAHINEEQELVELAFHGSQGQWRMIIGFQQDGDIRKLMFIIPHVAVVTHKRRLECLEALLAVNYRIAMGKFGLDLEDGEVRLEEAIPVALGEITFEQFQLVFSALMQTMAVYHSLIPRLVYSTLSVKEALEACERDFVQEIQGNKDDEQAKDEEPKDETSPLPSCESPELDVSDVLAELSRILEEKSE